MKQAASFLDVPGLGRLVAIPNSPPGEQFWAGTFHYDDGGHDEQSTFSLCAPGGAEPSSEQREFAHATLASIGELVRRARRLLKQKLENEPAFFGLDEAGAARYLAKGDHLLPFGAPEPTFYEPGVWQLRFAECPLPTCEQHGIAVSFVGDRPNEIVDPSDAEEVA